MRDDETIGSWLRLLAVTAVWLASFVLLAGYGARLLPLSVARMLTLESYLILVQLTALAIGLALSFWLLSHARDELGLLKPTARTLLVLALVTPAILVAASHLAAEIARSTLIEELRRGGLEAVRSQTGEFGRALTRAPVWSVLLWAAVVSPVAEELLFRGAIWSTVQRLIERIRPPAQPDGLPSQFLQESWLVSSGRRTYRWFLSGGVATLLSTAVFGFMHADKPGGLGIIRLVSACCLGLACGSARHASGNLAAPIILHVIFNTLSLASARRWVVTAQFPKYRMVPTMLWLFAAVGLLAALVLLLVRRRTPRQQP